MKKAALGGFLRITLFIKGFLLAGGEGFEPPLAESESAVLPLDEPPGNLGKRFSVWSTG